MSDLICRKTMMRCPTTDMCAPFQGCGPLLEAPTGRPPHVYTPAEELALNNALELVAMTEKLTAKDAEIAELRAAVSLAEARYEQANKLHLEEMDHHLQTNLERLKAERERDEARECVGRLYSAAIDVVAVADRATLIFDTMKDALSTTPEHLRK